MRKGIKILMVDDEAQFRATTQKILNKKGFETSWRPTARRRWKSSGNNPDVVVLDVKMPGMDGHEVLKEIKKRNRTCR
jgi:DNA-binding response OmpR family regulator